jgi:hypothetical protein
MKTGKTAVPGLSEGRGTPGLGSADSATPLD